MTYEIARTNYRPLRYSHIKISPGDDYVLTGDPWSYLHSHLQSQVQGTRGRKRKRLERALFYLGLAQNFYRAADAAELPAKATLIYYGMLNLVKVWLSTLGTELETSIEHHGITIPLDRPQSVSVYARTADRLSIFAEFCEALESPCANQQTHRFRDLLRHVPELHSVHKSHNPSERQKFLGVDIRFLTDTGHRKLLTLVTYDKKAEGLIPAQKIYRGPRQNYFKDPVLTDGKVHLYSRVEKRPANCGNLTRTYNEILGQYDNFDICSLLTRNGYQYYLDLDPGPYHHLACTFLVMYYLGTAARYRPSTMNDILSGPLRQSVTEACAICPKQFLYQLASRITNSLCVIPYAQI